MEYKLINFDDVKNITAEEYFSGDKYAVDMFNTKYALTKEDGGKETPAEVFWRVASNMASVEKNSTLMSEICTKCFSLMWDGWFRPGGSILSGIGVGRKASLMNCTTLPLSDDTLEAIAKCEYDIMKSAAWRQGIGVDFSKLRPRGARLGNAAIESTGVIPWMDKLNRVGDYVGQLGRKPALLESLIVSHPDIEEFIGCKEELDKINNANVSVQITNDFMEAVEKDSDWELKFEVKDTGEVITKTVRAKELFDKIAEHAWKTAEPGVQYRNLLQDGIMYKAIADELNDDRFLPHSSNACQPAFSLVLTPKGVKQLGQVNIGDIIWSGKNWTKIKDKWYTGNKEVFEYHTNSGVFVGTEDHRIVRKGKKIKVSEALSIDSCEGPVNTGKLIPEFIMDGLVIGDGSFHKASNNQVYLCIGANDNDYFESEISNLLIKNRTKGFNFGWEVKTSVDFTELPKTYDRTIPTRFLFGNPVEVRSFLRGLFSANGYYVDGRICLKQSSYELIKQVQFMLSSVGIRSYITKNKSKDIEFSNGVYNIKKSYDINISKDIDVFYNTIGFIQKYKMDAVNSRLITKKPYHKAYKYSFDITDKVSLGKHDVFEITVEDDDHTYWTGGVLVSNCSEKFMAPYSVCNLSSLNMEQFSIIEEEYKKQLDYIVPVITRMADNIIEYELVNNLSPLKEQKWIVNQLREIGLGITNLHGWLLKQDLAYDSDEATIVAEKFIKHYTYNVFKTSMQLGAEKGNAPAFDLIQDKSIFMKTTYFNNIVNEFFDGDPTKVVNMRNMAHMSIAPAGSLSNTFPSPCISSGVEPCIGLYYWRRTRALDKGNYTYYFIIPQRLKEYVLDKIDSSSDDYAVLKKFSGSERDEDGKIGKEIINIINKYIPSGFFKPAHEVDYNKKIKLMSSIYKWIDASISCTYNLPSSATKDDVKNIYINAYKNGVRAVSVYVDGSRQGILIFEDPITNKAKFETKNVICSGEVRPKNITYVCAPKRPEILPCNIHHVSVKGNPWTVLVGMLDDVPYELFCGQTEELYIPKTCKEGIITKYPGSKYSLTIKIRGQEVEYKDIAHTLMTVGERTITRLISLSMRHGCPLEFIQNQLKKANGDITEFSTCVARVLGSYIKEYKYNKDLKCPNCGQEALVREENCLKCSNCGNSKCG